MLFVFLNNSSVINQLYLKKHLLLWANMPKIIDGKSLMVGHETKKKCPRFSETNNCDLKLLNLQL